MSKELLPVVWLFVVLAAAGFSCLIARLAGGGRASPWWGVLGPVGWVLAALRGVQERVEELGAKREP